MTSTICKHARSLELQSAGFTQIIGRNTAQCCLCKLEISSRTADTNLFTIHAEQSPHCVFVRGRLKSIENQTFNLLDSSYDNDIVSARPSKKQKKERSSMFNEVHRLKISRQRTFALWRQPSTFISRMIKAGFFSCNVDDRVICIYCDLICEKWNIETDDPCELHKIVSPQCPYVMAKLNNDSLHCNNTFARLPKYPNYANPRERLVSFVTWSNNKFPTIDKLVAAGFFYNGCSITCFYCNGSFYHWESNNHPVAEHVRHFPYCNYARELCGEELYRKIQRAMKYIPENIRISELNDDPETLSKLVSARIDLPISKYLLEKENIERSVIESCWEYQLRHNNDDFIDNCDLRIACEILKKQNKLTRLKEKTIIIPSLVLKEFYKTKQTSCHNEHLLVSHSMNDSEYSYIDVLQSFENDLEKYKSSRQKLAAHFIEQPTINIARERSLKSWSCSELSRRDIMKAGWIMCDNNFCTMCPHCHMHYYDWKANDDPLLIHEYLSPNCLFVLSPNPFKINEIPVRKVADNFTDEEIINAEYRPYTGLLQSKHDSVYKLSKREVSFNRFPGGCPTNANELAKSGLYYTNIGRIIRCFYCQRQVIAVNRGSQSHLCLVPSHLPSQCRYVQQLNDFDQISSTQAVSNKCTWCMMEEKKLMALPCRHFALCEPCGQLKRICSVCEKDVKTYIIVYSP